MSKRAPRATGSVLIGLFLLVLVAIVVLPYILRSTYKIGKAGSVASSTTLAAIGTTTAAEAPAAHVAAPTAIKALYMTACVASTSTWRENLKQEINNTELNALVIDIKDYTGTISFIDPRLQDAGAGGCRVKDLKEFVAELHRDNIYVIGRVTVFQDPYYAKTHPDLAIKSKSTGNIWKDNKGLPFIDVGAKPYWDHVIDIAMTSYALGFDEINFDYVRYPSDGNLKDMNTTWTVGSSTKAQMVKTFFSYLYDHLKNTGLKTSADLFGLVTVATDDMGIGQVLENALPYFDYIDPMVYPSHFAAGADGYQKPAEHPYDIVHYSMQGGLKREMAQRVALGLSTSTPSKLRPWLQDFDLGATYGVAEVRAQIKASEDLGLKGWLMWDASNKYTPGAYLPK